MKPHYPSVLGGFRGRGFGVWGSLRLWGLGVLRGMDPNGSPVKQSR